VKDDEQSQMAIEKDNGMGDWDACVIGMKADWEARYQRAGEELEREGAALVAEARRESPSQLNNDAGSSDTGAGDSQMPRLRRAARDWKH
jgi:hypothetical protein